MKWFLGVFGLISLSAWGMLEFVFPRPGGHWHLFDKEGLFRDSLDNFCVLDFNKNQIHLEDWIMGNTSRLQKKLFVGGECYYEVFDYHFSEDSLILTSLYETKEDTFVKRIYALPAHNCTKEQHFFRHSNVDLKLSEIQDTIEFDRIKNMSLLEGIEIGKDKRNDFSKNMKAFYFQGSKEVTGDDIPLFLEKLKIIAPAANHDKIQLAFYADKETKIKHLKPILQKLAEIPDRPKVVLVFQYNPQPDDFELFGKEVVFEGVDWSVVEEELLFSEYVLGQ